MSPKRLDQEGHTWSNGKGRTMLSMEWLEDVSMVLVIGVSGQKAILVLLPNKYCHTLIFPFHRKVSLGPISLPTHKQAIL
jgi:hypothetical protein